MDCKHERQARLDQWIEDQTGSACAFCLKAEVERLNAQVDTIGSESDPMMIELRRQKDENERLRKALADVREWVQQIETDERVSGWIHQEDYGLYCLLAGGCPVNFDEVLKDSDPEPERWGCCGAERNEIHGQYCPRCS